MHDDEVLMAADEQGIAMLLTGVGPAIASAVVIPAQAGIQYSRGSNFEVEKPRRTGSPPARG